MDVIKNRLAELVLDLSGPAKEEVLGYLSTLHAIKRSEDDPEEKKQKTLNFEKSYRSKSFRTDMYCVIANYTNQSPYLCIVLSLALLYNVAWVMTKIIKNFL